jgi:DNA polymerase III epsilon subunit-like protein
MSVIAGKSKPVFVGFNACFDWSFVNWYFHKFTGENPFGFSALDIKAYYMGFSGCKWSETTSSQLPNNFQPIQPATHNALDDARAQGEIFSKLISR